jgi:hypothetical protein
MKSSQVEQFNVYPPLNGLFQPYNHPRHRTGRGKVTWKKNHERRGHHARYQKRRQERENEAPLGARRGMVSSWRNVEGQIWHLVLPPGYLT